VQHAPPVFHRGAEVVGGAHRTGLMLQIPAGGKKSLSGAINLCGRGFCLGKRRRSWTRGPGSCLAAAI
jgi:hypothetical protein